MLDPFKFDADPGSALKKKDLDHEHFLNFTVYLTLNDYFFSFVFFSKTCAKSMFTSSIPKARSEKSSISTIARSTASSVAATAASSLSNH